MLGNTCRQLSAGISYYSENTSYIMEVLSMGNNIEERTIIVEGMSCAHCKNTVEKAVSSLTGVHSAIVDLQTKTLSVEFDTRKTTVEQIKEAVDEQGFTVV